ncbi:MAG: GatB/YqeY domain-containing protein, partial [Gammaproteobacteria bacterium]|nr:GatB/YqeY domain-containing protein [Gammaproteobacteria bacterium]
MALKDRLTEDMKGALRAGDKERLGTVRLALAAIKQREVDERVTLDDAQVLGVLEKLIKQRREAIAQFAGGGRTDLVEKETAEIGVLSGYLPAQLSESELTALIEEAIRASGAA